jgi:hypothetical protein
MVARPGHDRYPFCPDFGYGALLASNLRQGHISICVYLILIS